MTRVAIGGRAVNTIGIISQILRSVRAMSSMATVLREARWMTARHRGQVPTQFGDLLWRFFSGPYGKVMLPLPLQLVVSRMPL